jgi:predicted ATP-grasp superfamily ATP-dependent carboligase
MVSSKIASKCYAKKKILDKRGVDPKMKFVLTIATLMAIASLWTVYESFNNSDNKILLYVSHILISVSLMSVFISLVINWMSKVVPPITFNQMVKKDLDDFYGIINMEGR